MGFHVCEYCADEDRNKYQHRPSSSGDCKIETEEMRIWFPDMVLHYIVDHLWLPPQFFIDAIMNNDPEKLTEHRCDVFHCDITTKQTEKVGYLSGEYPIGEVSKEFISKLNSVMDMCSANGSRLQTKGL